MSDPETYEALYARLETIVAALEQGDLPLDRALREYEQGVTLAASCQKLLDQAELKVQQILDGTLKPLDSGQIAR